MEVGEFNPLFAILHHGSVILCPNRSKWVAWMKEAHAAGTLIIAQDSIEGFQVATIFLGIDFNEGGIGPPLWFETVVFRRLTDGSLGFQPKTDFRYRTAVILRFAKKSGTAKSGNEPRRTGVHAGPMLIKAYRIESRRHGSIDCQPVLMGIVHFTEGIDQDQLFEQERVAVNLVMDHSPFSHDVKRGAETWDAESTNVDDELLGAPSFEDPLKNYRIWLSH
jgi:hypothetical protein